MNKFQKVSFKGFRSSMCSKDLSRFFIHFEFKKPIEHFELIGHFKQNFFKTQRPLQETWLGKPNNLILHPSHGFLLLPLQNLNKVYTRF